MSIDLNPQEVLEHLYSLGYHNITKEQLAEFIKDLKKLIKYDLRKKERKHTVHHHSSINDKENACMPSTSSSPAKHTCSCVPGKEYVNIQPVKDVPLRDSCNLAKPIESSETSDDALTVCPNCHQFGGRVEVHSSKKIPSHKSDIDESDSGLTSEECPHHDEPQKVGAKATKMKKSNSKLKPCPSFIRPTSAKTNKAPARADPVALYHYYKTLWSQYTLPGENSHEDLRWRIRHKMMANPLTTKGNQEEKSSKRPDWIPS